MDKEKKKVEKSSNKAPEKAFIPFEKEHKIVPLKLLVVVVPSGQANTIVNYLYTLKVSSAFVLSGEGTGISNPQHDTFGVSGSRKQVIWAIVREDQVPAIKKKLKERFSVSRLSAGMALTVKLSSLAGVSLYKFFTGTGMVEEVNKDGK